MRVISHQDKGYQKFVRSLDRRAEPTRELRAVVNGIVEEVRKRGGTTVITADHGNSEQLWDPTTDQPHTAHTLNPVPVVFCGDALVGSQIRERGVLADVAPTLLGLMGMAPSAGMDGKSLLG